MKTHERLVIVDGVGALTHRWAWALRDLRPEIVAAIDDAGDLGASDVVIIDMPRLSSATLEAIARSTDVPRATRILTADHDELAEILKRASMRSSATSCPAPGAARRFMIW